MQPLPGQPTIIRNTTQAEDAFIAQVKEARDPAAIFDAAGKRIQQSVVFRPTIGSKSVPETSAPLDMSKVQTFSSKDPTNIVEPLSHHRLSHTPGDGSSEVGKHSPRKIRGGDQTLSRWVRRGVQYPKPVETYFSMLWVLISRVLFYVVMIGTPLVLITSSGDGSRDALWNFLAVPVVFIVFSIGHLLIASRTKCKICSCPLLYSRRCHKNKKAHPRFPLGYAGSTALHAVIYRWFRCMYCGTAIQLGKKDKE